MRRIKSVLVGIMCVMLLMPTMVMATSEAKIVSGIIIDKTEDVPAGEAGQKVKIKIPIRNLKGIPVDNVIVFPVRDADEKVYPFTMEKTNEYAEYGTIKHNETVTRELEFTVKKDVLSKEYTLKFQIYYDGASEKEDLKREIVINIKGIEPTVTPTTKPTKTPKPTKLPIDDEGDDLGGGYAGGDDDYPGGGGGDMGGGDGEEKKAGTPRVIVEGFRTEPKVVNAGSSFKLILEIRNTSKKTAVNNMEINLQAADSADNVGDEGGSGTASDTFLPDKGSNTLYVDAIAADSTKEVSIDLTARADLQQQPYSIGVAMKYEDSKAEQYEAMSEISIPVNQKARFELSQVEVSPESIEVGGEGNVIFSIYNLGRTKLYNVKVELISATIADGEAFVGNLEAGATGEVDLMVTGVTETTDDGTVKIQISYEDKDGNASNFEDSCTIFVMPAMEQGEMPFDQGMEMIEEEQGGLGVLAIIGIIVGILAVIAAGTFGIIKYKRKKEEDFADEFLGSDKDERK